MNWEKVAIDSLGAAAAGKASTAEFSGSSPDSLCLPSTTRDALGLISLTCAYIYEAYAPSE
jgi:hypothetical protein